MIAVVSVSPLLAPAMARGDDTDDPACEVDVAVIDQDITLRYVSSGSNCEEGTELFYEIGFAISAKRTERPRHVTFNYDVVFDRIVTLNQQENQTQEIQELRRYELILRGDNDLIETRESQFAACQRGWAHDPPDKRYETDVKLRKVSVNAITCTLK